MHQSVSTLDSAQNTEYLIRIKYKDDLFSRVLLVNHIRYTMQQTTGERAKLPSISLKTGICSYYSGPVRWASLRPVVLTYHEQILIVHEKRQLCANLPPPLQ